MRVTLSVPDRIEFPVADVIAKGLFLM